MDTMLLAVQHRLLVLPMKWGTALVLHFFHIGVSMN